MSNAPLTQDRQLSPIKALCAKLAHPGYKETLKQCLPPNVDVDRFVRTTMNGIQTHPQQDKLINSDHKTLLLACQKAASDGVVLDGREGVLVCFWNKTKKTNDVSYIPMVQGLVKIARNSGEIKKIIAEVVFKNDPFEYEPGVNEQPVFKPDWFSEDRGEPIGAFAVVVLMNGECEVKIMAKSRILEIASGGNNAAQYSTGAKHYTEWWRKTVIRSVLKYAPKSSELMTAVQGINTAEYGNNQPAEVDMGSAELVDDDPGFELDQRSDEEKLRSEDVFQEEEYTGPWPRYIEVDDSWVDAFGVVFDGDLNAFDVSKGCPTVNKDGGFESKVVAAKEEVKKDPENKSAFQIAVDLINGANSQKDFKKIAGMDWSNMSTESMTIIQEKIHLKKGKLGLLSQA